MPTAVEDPLIATMAIGRPLPIHESSRRLRTLVPDSPRVHGVAVLADVSRRRWWPLDSAVADGRLRAMFEASAAELGSRRGAGQQLTATLVHAVAGRVVTLLAVEGRAWDAGPGNLWLHNDSEGTVDWAGVTDPTLRVLPDDPAPDNVVRLPGEAALATWTAHRCHLSLAPLFVELHRLTGGALTTAAMWRMVGSCVVVTATRIPLRTGTGELTCMRRGQAVLDALTSFGLPVRALRRAGT